jgi:hypothetical protein
MSRTETTTDTTATSSTTQGRSARSRSTNCRCGQQLDVCARAHCPRCGRTLHHR